MLLNGWQLNVIASLYSGLPFTVLSGTDRSRVLRMTTRISSAIPPGQLALIKCCSSSTRRRLDQQQRVLR